MTGFAHLPWDAPLAAYTEQAELLLARHAARDEVALAILHQSLPMFLDADIPWKPRNISAEEIAATALSLDDMRLAIARVYSFLDWSALRDTVVGIASDNATRVFEDAVDAVVRGDDARLSTLLASTPLLVHRRSTRVTCHDPAVHGATLLHYLAANGVEGFRQHSPRNAVHVATLLLDAGALPDALAGMYGSACAPLSMLVSSSPPADAGVQVPLVHCLIDHGANVEGAGSGTWASPLLTALVFGFRDAAEALVARGARVDTVVKAAGLGRIAETESMYPAASREDRHRAFALATMNRHVDVVRLLLTLGEDPNRFHPNGFHSHATPLHQAALVGDMAMVHLLVQHGARTDIRDTLWDGTPVGWAEHGGQHEVVTYFRSRATGL